MSYISQNNAYKVIRVSSLPTTGELGALYLNTTTKVLWIYDGINGWITNIMFSDFVYDYYARYNDIPVGGYANKTRKIIVLLDETDSEITNSYESVNGILQKTLGKSAYQVAVDNGFSGSQTDWLVSIQGKVGKSLGAYNVATNTPTLTAIPSSSFVDGDYYDLITSGSISFGGVNFTSGSQFFPQDQLKKIGNQWYRVPFTIGDSTISTTKVQDYSITPQKTSFFVDNFNVSSKLSTGFANAWIGSTGDRINLATNFITRKIPVTAGEKYYIKLTLSATISGGNPVNMRAYGFYSDFNIPSSSNFISGSSITSSNVNIADIITIPTNCTCLMISDYTTSSLSLCRYDNLTSYLLQKDALVDALGLDTTKIASQSTVTQKIFQLFDSFTGLSTNFNSNGWIGDTGAKVNVTTDYVCRKIPVTAGEKYLISMSLPSVGGTPIVKRAYAFYNSFTTVDNTTFISGSPSTGSAITIFEEVTIPTNCVCLAFSDVTASTVVKLAKINAVPQDIGKGVTAYNYTENLKVINTTQSRFGILGNNQGITESESLAFQGFWMNYNGNVRTRYINYTAGGKNTISFRSTSTDAIIGSLYCNFAQTFYSMHAIYSSTGDTNNNEIIGYCLLNPSLLARPVFLTYWVTFNNSIDSYNRFISGKKFYPKVIELMGDSLTALGSGYANFFNVEGCVINAHGIGGEIPKQILGRLGVFPYQIKTDISIPATTTAVSLPLKSSWDGLDLYPREKYGMNPVTIKGIQGNITVTGVGTSATFTRITSGSDVLIKSNEPLVTYESKALSNQFLILWMGQNGSLNPDELVFQYEAVARLKGDNNFIFITPHLNTSTDLETKMMQKFARNYVNMRDWSVKYGLTDSGITPVQADLDAIALGNCPPSLLSDDIHFVASARQAIANMLSRKYQELAY